MDWAWIALRHEPVADPPTIYFDQDSGTRFPPDAVMPVDELRGLVLEWCDTGKRPVSVGWRTVNALRWTLGGDRAAPRSG